MSFELKNIRTGKNLSRRELAEMSGVSEQNIQRLEDFTSDPREAKLLTLEKLAKALRCRVRDFFPKEKYI